MLTRNAVLTIASVLCATNPARAIPIPEFDTGLDSAFVAAAPTSATWTRLGPGPATSEVFAARLGTYAVYDPVADRMVLFGGYSAGFLDDTWSLALGGASPAWSRLATPGVRPRVRVWHGEVYDPVRRRMLVIGGLEPSGGYLNDVWQLDLAAATPAWTQVATQGTAPVARECRGALYDPVRDRVLLFGGYSYPNHLNDVWALDLAGTPTWRRLTPAGTPPSSRRAMSLTYDPVGDRLVVIGGHDDLQFMNDVWALGLSGAPAWQRLLPSGAVPPGRYGHTATYDPARREIVVFGGYNGQFLNDMYVLSLSGAPAWSAIASVPRPSLRDFHTVAFDPPRNRMVLIGGNGTRGALGDLWALNPATRAWTEITPPQPAWPRNRLGTFAVHDAAGDRVTLFGGYDAGFLDDTWSLAPGGAEPAWTRLATTGAHPSLRVWHAEVFDPVRRRMLVIGGLEPSGGYLIDVWQLDLASPAPTWSPLAVQGAPPAPRECRGGLYDPVRDRVLIFGGYGYPDHFNDVWALDLAGTPTWNQLSPAGTPPAPRRAMSMTYDPEGDRVLIFGGYDQVEYMNDLWALEFTGHPRWQKLHTVGTVPPVRYGHSATYDPVRGQMFVYGGYNGLYLGDAYVLPLQPPLNWSPIVATGPDPGLRDFHTVVFDPVRDRFLLYGGNVGGALGDLWALTFAGATAGSRSTGQGAGGLARPAGTGSVAEAAGGAHRLALEGFAPNPARAGIQVAFTLPSASPARLEMFDLAGRLVRSRSFDAPQPGRHTADFGRAQELRPGVYVLRLTQDRRTVSARGAVVP